jgi:predicted  nucleic acid-binding Zn-ribbon protein
MDNDLLRKEFSALERKVSLLLNEHKKIRTELSQLQSENAGLRDELKERDELIANFQNKFKISKIVNSIDTEGHDTSELKRKIDEYIKEIDRCIAHVS